VNAAPAVVEPQPVGLCSCGCGLPAPIAKKASSSKGHVKGQPLRFVHGHHARLQPSDPYQDPTDRFWSQVDRTTTPDGCWPWTGYRDRKGYGVILVNGRMRTLFVIDDPLVFRSLKQIADFAARNRLPATAIYKQFAEAGGLMTFGASLADLNRRAAIFVDKILKGAKPRDLPVEQPTKYELVINLKTGKALGLTIPPSLLQRADQVIE